MLFKFVQTNLTTYEKINFYLCLDYVNIKLRYAFQRNNTNGLF